jgi:hypothetical protein
MEDLTWEDLAQVEPRLLALLKEIAAAGAASPRFCSVSAWHGFGGRQGFKMRLWYLAGSGARNPALRSREAYDVAFETLYGALPDCRGCGCAKQQEESDEARAYA